MILKFQQNILNCFKDIHYLSTPKTKDLNIKKFGIKYRLVCHRERLENAQKILWDDMVYIYVNYLEQVKKAVYKSDSKKVEQDTMEWGGDSYLVPPRSRSMIRFPRINDLIFIDESNNFMEPQDISNIKKQKKDYVDVVIFLGQASTLLKDSYHLQTLLHRKGRNTMRHQPLCPIKILGDEQDSNRADFKYTDIEYPAHFNIIS